MPEALQGLPKQQQRALLLREWQGLSYKEIAEELDLTQSAVETLLFRARRSLAAGLTDDAAQSKGIARKLRAGTDAGSLLAVLQSLVSVGGAKVAATVATVAATSVVATTPTGRHAVEQAVSPAKPQHVAPAARPVEQHAGGSRLAASPASVRPASLLASSTTNEPGRTPVAAAKRGSLHLAHHLRANTGTSAHPPARTAEAAEPTPLPTPPAEPVVDLPPAAAAVPPSAAASRRHVDRSDVRANTTRSGTHGGHRSEAPAPSARERAEASVEPTAPPVWEPPGNSVKKQVRQSRHEKSERPEAQLAPSVSAPAPAAPPVAAAAPPAVATPAPVVEEDPRDSSDHGHGHGK